MYIVKAMAFAVNVSNACCYNLASASDLMEANVSPYMHVHVMRILVILLFFFSLCRLTAMWKTERVCSLYAVIQIVVIDEERRLSGSAGLRNVARV